MITPSSTRKSDGWHPTLLYANGGRVVGRQALSTMEAAHAEAEEMVVHMEEFPGAYSSNHPAPNQLIDLLINRPLDKYNASHLANGKAVTFYDLVGSYGPG